MSEQPEFEMTSGRTRTDHDMCIVSCGIGPHYQEGLHSTRLHCEVNVPEAWRLQPKTVLDLGIGFGKYGPLLREVLDAMHGRCAPGLWKAHIYGVEAHGAYRNPAWECYDDVGEQNFYATRIDHTGGNWQANWDLVLMIDSLEHLEPETGRRFLDELVKNNKHVIISVPVVPMPQGAMYGNEYETHRTHHDGSEFERFNPVTLYKGMTQVFSIKGKL